MDERRTSLKRAGRTPVLVAILAVLLAGGALAVRIAQERAASPAPTGAAPPEGAAPAASSPAMPDAIAEDPGPEAPAPAALVEAVSRDERVQEALARPGWVRRWAIVADNLAEGASPRRELAALAPRGAFAVVRRGPVTAIAPEAYARYDAFADAVASVDAAALATLYRAVHAPVEAAYRALGYPSAPFEAVVARALRRIEAAPVADGDVAVVEEGGVWAFADARLEALPEVEKHLLRMGPRNTRLLQEKARELSRALALPPLDPTARSR
jgi:hypothetical protein